MGLLKLGTILKYSEVNFNQPKIRSAILIRSITSKLHEIGLGDIRTDRARRDIYVRLEVVAVMFM